MTLKTDLQPDQQTALWDDHVAVYESVFEPLTTAFGRRALDLLAPRTGSRIIDVGAGSGGVALLAQSRGIDVLAIDASERMVERIRERADAVGGRPGRIRAEVMDGAALTLPDDSFDAGISVFGVVLLPDAKSGVREMTRVVRPGAPVAVVTWTEMERYELAARLLDAIAAVRGPQPPPMTLPAQLRFREPAVFQSLLASAGLNVKSITRLEEQWTLPSAAWIAQNVAFAPGMSAMVRGLGHERDAVMQYFVSALERDQGPGEVTLSAVAHTGIGVKPDAQ
ncbi:MAG: methyltransferase domain-containing protein [Rhizobiales bacterium]|nr:methyltransferase domain-containing protein [Hyphomicrobiales bacterium]